MNRKWEDRIQVNPDIHHGDPIIRGTRIPLYVIVGSLADGMTMEQVQGEYPQLGKEDIYAALAYAAEMMHQDILLPLSI